MNEAKKKKMKALCVYIGFLLFGHIKEGHSLQLIIDKDLLRFEDAVQTCQNLNSGSLLDPKSSSTFDSRLRNVINGPFWIGIQQYYSQFVSHEGCMAENIFEEITHHHSKYASIGYCSTFCTEMNSTYFTFLVSRDCICLRRNSSNDVRRCSFRCSARACKGGQYKDVYHTVNRNDLQIGIDCMVVKCLNGNKRFEPRRCFERAGAACGNGFYLNNLTTKRDTTEKCLEGNRHLSSINDDLCQDGDVRNNSYWINPKRHVYDALVNHTGGEAKQCSGKYMVFTGMGSNRTSIPNNCSDAYAHVCVVDDGKTNITVQFQADLHMESSSSQKSKGGITTEYIDVGTNSSQEVEITVESNDEPGKIYLPVLGVALIIVTGVVTFLILQKSTLLTFVFDVTIFGRNISIHCNSGKRTQAKKAWTDMEETNIQSNAKSTNEFQSADHPKRNAKDTKTSATNYSIKYSSPIPMESGIYEEQGDGIYDKMNSTRKKKGNEYAENNIYNEASYPDDSNVYNTFAVTAQLSSNISCDTEYGYGKIETME